MLLLPTYDMQVVQTEFFAAASADKANRLFAVVSRATLQSLVKEPGMPSIPERLQTLDALAADWEVRHGATAAVLEQRQRAAGLHPVITAAQLKAPVLALRVHLSRALLGQEGTPRDAATRASFSARRAAAGELVRPGGWASPAHWQLYLAIFAIDYGEPAAAVPLLRQAVQAAEHEKGGPSAPLLLCAPSACVGAHHTAPSPAGACRSPQRGMPGSHQLNLDPHSKWPLVDG